MEKKPKVSLLVAISSDYTIASHRLLSPPLYTLQQAFIALCDEIRCHPWILTSPLMLTLVALCCAPSSQTTKQTTHCNESCFMCFSLKFCCCFFARFFLFSFHPLRARDFRVEIIFTINDINLLCCVLCALLTYANSVLSHAPKKNSYSWVDIARGVEIETNEMSELNIEDGKVVVVVVINGGWSGGIGMALKWNEKERKWEQRTNVFYSRCCCVLYSVVR